jgi:hypothetical protein
MSKSLFDHLNSITKDQDPKYWDTLDESDKKTFSNFMVHRFLSMNRDWIEILSEIQPYTQTLEPKQLYLTLIGIIPKGRHFLKYMKGKGESKYESFLVDLVSKNFECSKNTALEYCDILYSTRYGRESIQDLCERYGIDKKEITKLKLKV